MLRAGTVRKKGLCPPFLKGRYSFVKGQTSTSALKRFMNKDNTVGHVFAFPFIFGFVCFSLIPVCISFYYAFTQAMIITNGGPNNSTMLYALYVYNQAFKYNDMGYACAMSWFMLVVMGLITFIIFKTSKFWVFSEAN